MGAWGVGILDNDAALDTIGDCYKMQFRGYSQTDISRIIQSKLTPPDDNGPELLALIVWEMWHGGLEASSKNYALRALEMEMEDQTLQSWDDPRDRLKELSRLKRSIEDLTSEPNYIKSLFKELEESIEIVHKSLVEDRQVSLN